MACYWSPLNKILNRDIILPENRQVFAQYNFQNYVTYMLDEFANQII